MTFTNISTVVVNPDTCPIKLAYEVHGTGDNRALLIMGMGGSMELWKFQVEFLVKHNYKVCVFDNRGSGRSDVPDTKYTIKEMMNDTIGLLNHLGWTSNVHILGGSLGGMIAMTLAINHPSYVKSLVLACTMADATLPKNKEITVDPIRKMLSGEVARPNRDPNESFPKEWLEAPSDDDPSINNLTWISQVMMDLAKTMPPQPEKGVLGQFHALETHRVTDEELMRIRDASIPTAVCTGDLDKVVDMSNSVSMAKVLDASLHIFPGCGHGLPLQAKNKLNELLLSHFQAVDNK
ncbi:Alpha/Beta hydrolase protein [Syncephalis plumigaleata]|nr:Alpha/Beta hydrolase protein [Syncephalis plumigaleata]